MTINERFGKVIRTLYGGNKRAFATDAGIAATVVENIVGKRQGKPSFDVIEKVCALANVNTEWLVTGRGEPFDFRTDEEKATAAKNSGVELKLLDMLAEKDDIIRKQAEEIGQLRERLEQTTRRLEKIASNAHTSDIADVG